MREARIYEFVRWYGKNLERASVCYPLDEFNAWLATEKVNAEQKTKIPLPQMKAPSNDEMKVPSDEDLKHAEIIAALQEIRKALRFASLDRTNLEQKVTDIGMSLKQSMADIVKDIAAEAHYVGRVNAQLTEIREKLFPAPKPEPALAPGLIVPIGPRGVIS